MTYTDWQLRMDTCRIELWRGYVTSSFVARSTDGDGAAVSEGSPLFRWRGKRPPDSPEAKLAHEDLLKRLEAEGWSVCGYGDDWYEVELARPAALPWSEPEPEPEPEAQTSYIEPDLLPPPLPAPVMSNVVPLPAVERPPREPWRVTAAIALACALLFLLVLFLH